MQHNQKEKVMILNEFKNDARVETFDNTENAQKNWSKCWGLGYWEDLWRYKEYKIGTLKYRTGKVFKRHTNYSLKKFYYKDNEISEKEFKEKISLIEFKPKEIIIKENLISKNKKVKQMSLFEMV